MKVSKPAITRALDRLGEFDLARRKTDPSDRRSVLVQRTAKGAAFLREIHGIMAVASGEGKKAGRKAADCLSCPEGFRTTAPGQSGSSLTKTPTARRNTSLTGARAIYCAMPFDVHEFPGASRMDRAAARKGRRAMAIWLFTVAAMILVMIVLGGATRLTGSGLSIMEWAPLMGALPPMSEAEWHRLFALYQKIPQYALVNQGFGLDGFKHIFWLEWTHRLWGRLIGVVFLVPLVWFGATRGSSAGCCRASPCCSCSAACRAPSAGSWWRPASCPTAPRSRPIGWSFTSCWRLLLYARSSGPACRCCVRPAGASQTPAGPRVMALDLSCDGGADDRSRRVRGRAACGPDL